MEKRNSYAWNQRVIETSRIKTKVGFFAYMFDACKALLPLSVSSRGYNFPK